jgi:hypothetical protein
MKFRTFITPLAVVSGLVLIVGLALLGGLLLRNPLALIEQGGLKTPAALQFVPKQATVVASVLTRPDRLTDMWEYLTAPGLRQQTRRDIEQIEQTLLAGTGLDYKQDIVPWLGEEITAAVFSADLDQTPDNGAEPGYFVALACEDSSAARGTLELFWQNRAIAGDTLIFEDFAGNRLIYSGQKEVEPTSAVISPSNRIGQLATTLVANRFMLVANHPEVLRQALNAAQSADTNLASDRRYRSALSALPNTRVGLLTVNFPAVKEAIQDSGSFSARQQLRLTDLGELGDNPHWGMMSVGLTREGLLGDLALVAAPGQGFQPRTPHLTDLSKTAYYLPEQTAIAAVGGDLLSLWPSLQLVGQRLGLGSRQGGREISALAEVVQESTAKPLIKNVIGEFSLGLNLGDTLDWLFVSQWNDVWSDVLLDIQSAAQSRGLGVNTLTIEGYPTNALARLTLKTAGDSAANTDEVVAQVLGLQAKVDSVNIMASSPNLMRAALSRPKNTPTLPAWAQNLSLFQKPNEGYIHIQWPKLQSGLKQHIAQFRLWEAAAKPALRHLRAITLTSYGRTENLHTGRVYFQLSN